MISFYPGPSRVYDDIPKYVKEAYRKGILSMNHRSDEFVALCRQTVTLLKEKLNIPASYTVFFTSSATECWEVIAQSLILRSSTHVYNGAFGEKWFDYTQRLVRGAKPFPFDKEATPDVKKMFFHTDLICLTHNETSNGTQLSNAFIATVRRQNPASLIAVDATSSMAGVRLNFSAADIWFASVQKCFGLPAGLAVMVCSPKAIAKVKTIGEKKHYNSLLFMNEMMGKWQTSFTPNVMGIFLLLRTLQQTAAIKITEENLKRRYALWETVVDHCDRIRPFIENKKVRSTTVLTLTGAPGYISKIKAAARQEGFLLGEGYGALKKNTFRIANFPALKDREVLKMMKFIIRYANRDRLQMK